MDFRTTSSNLNGAFELGRRFVRQTRSNGTPVKAPEDVARFFMDEMKHYDKEYFKAAFLNTKNQILKTVTVSIGSLNASIVHPREILKPAIAASAASGPNGGIAIRRNSQLKSRACIASTA